MQDTLFETDDQAQNNEYTVLARKYRPQNFSQLIGQDVVVTTFKNAILQNRVHHAFIMTGTRGIGKTTTARIIAKSLNCLNPQDQFEPCGKCDNCISIMRDQHPDIIEIDAASNTSVDNIREITESAIFKPVSAKYKIFIIDEVHMLSKSAFNALLKTLEEPPAHVKFIFATTEIRKLPITIISRCQRFDLHRVSIEQLAEHFNKICELEGAKAEMQAINAIATAAKGSVRDGLSMLDQAISLSERNVTQDIVSEMLGSADIAKVIALFHNVVEGELENALYATADLYKNGAEPMLVLEDLSRIIYNLTRYKVLAHSNPTISEAERNACETLAPKLSLIYLTRAWQLIQRGMEDMAASHFAYEELEMIIIKLQLFNTEQTPEQLLSNNGDNTKKAPSTSSTSSSQKKITSTNFDYQAVVEHMVEKGELLLYHYAFHHICLVSAQDDIVDFYDKSAEPDLKVQKTFIDYVGEHFGYKVRFVEGDKSNTQLKSLAELKQQSIEDKSTRLEAHPLVQKILQENDNAKVVNIELN